MSSWIVSGRLATAEVKFKQKMGLRAALFGRIAGARRVAGLGAAALFCALAVRAEAGCASAPGDRAAGTGRVTAVNQRLELTLADGRLLKLAGLDPPRPTPGRPDLDLASGAELAEWLVGKEVSFRLVETRPDRWGRLAAEVVLPPAGAAPALPVAEAALGEGLARFEPAGAPSACRAELLAAEQSARAGALGLWADPYYAVIAASDHDAFAERAGTSVLVEGRVTDVEPSPYRTTLRFGPRRYWDFSVTILQRNTKIFSAAGLSLESFKGRTIRVRGLLDMRFGPQIEISGPEEIEAVAPGNDQAGAAAAPRP